MTNRVVITGYGVVSAIGNSPEEFWNNLKAGKTGIGPITHFDAEATGISVAAEVKEFPFDKYFQKKDARRMDTFSLYAVYAALDAMEMSGITEENTNFDRLGCIMASGIGGLEQSQKNSQAIVAKGPRKGVAPLYVPLAIANMATGNVALRTGARGVSRAEVTACAAGTHAVGEAYKSIVLNSAQKMLVVGAESTICPVGIGGFAAMKALSTRNDDPQHASRPFDKERDGFVMGEGAGALVLESYDDAVKRGAKIYAELIGFGESADAHHITSPTLDGPLRAMKKAWQMAGNAKIDYINAHGTSTPANDKNETAAIKELFGSSVPLVSSTKGQIGHCLGGAGAIEAVICLMAMRDGIVPPTINQLVKDEECDLDYVANHSRKADLSVVMSNSFGFGGTNGSIIFKKVQ